MTSSGSIINQFAILLVVLSPVAIAVEPVQVYSAQRHTMLRLLVVLCAHAVLLVTSDECEYPRCAACPCGAHQTETAQ